MSEKLISVEEARARILSGVAALDAEEVPLALAAGRVLAAPVTARRDQPPGAVSAMDGYAISAADAAAIGAELTLNGSIGAGDDPKFTLKRGEAARIFTGALLPTGADAVIAQEDTASLPPRRVRINETATPGKHVRAAGADFKAGETILLPGRTLDGRDLALAAAMNASSVRVYRRPRVAILATGNELVPLGGDPGRHQIIASTGPALCAAFAKWGAEPIDLGIAPDDELAISARIKRGASADLLVTLGGASVGDHDLVQRSLEQLGFALGFWKIAMKPGKPLIFGRLGAQPVIGLPGNPVSSLICALIFIRPLIRTLQGADDLDLPVQSGVLARELPANGPRLDFLRARFEAGDGAVPRLLPFDRQDSNQLSILSQAQCLIPRNPFAPESKAGDVNPYISLAGLF